MGSALPWKIPRFLTHISRSRILTHGTVSVRARQEDVLKCNRCLSASTQVKESSPRRVFRTTEDDPRKHTLNHVGMYYKLSDSNVNGPLKNCIHPWHLRMMKTFNEHCLMVRQPSLELNGYLKSINLNHPVPRFVLYGRRGAGKNCSLLHSLHFCSLENWIIVHVPYGGRWVRGWYKEVAESTHKPGRYDLPTDAAEWLSHFQLQNQDKLQNLKTTSEYVWTKREKADVGTPIVEIINFGLNRLKFSSDCVGVILKELRQQAASEKLKVLVVVECVNAFFTPWTRNNALQNSEKKKLLPGEISIIHNFKKMIRPTWNHGAVVCTVEENCNDYDIREDYTPIYLSGKEGFECLDPFVPILVPEYSEKETRSNIDYFIDRNWIQSDYGKTEDGKKEIIFVSNKNPFNLYRVCSPL